MAPATPSCRRAGGSDRRGTVANAHIGCRNFPPFRLSGGARTLTAAPLLLFIYRAFAESLAGEHAHRLAAMQRVETNVEERLDMLEQTHHRRRQRAITEEVLDITAGFEVLRTDSRREAAETVSEDAGW